ncbi:MAG: MFS transporter [Kiritimatiellae bacterium]|nr:MFS transporter [Kiritimatiellia bacterium]
MKKIDYKWFALFLLWVAFFLQQGTRQVYGPLLGSIQGAVGATDIQLGFVSTVFTLVYGITIPFAGFAADLFSRKWMVVAGVAIFSAGILTSGFVTCIGALVVTYGFVNGFGQPFYYPSSTSLISQLHADSKATALSLLQLGMYGGVIGCSWLAGWFAGLGTEGWRLPFKVLGALGLCWAAVLALTLRNTGISRSRTTEDTGSQLVATDTDTDRVTIGAALKAMFTKPAAVLIALALGMEVYVDVGFKTWMPNYLSETFHVSKASAGLNAVLWHYLGAALGIVIGSRIGDRLVKRHPTIRFWVIGGGLLLGAPFIFLMSQATTYLICCVAMFLFGVFRGAYDSNNFAAFFDVVEPRYHASAAGFNLMIAFLFGCFSPTVLGWTKEHYSMATGLATLSCAYLAGVVLLVFACRFFATPKPRSVADR